MKLRLHLSALVLASVLPVILFAGLIIYTSYRQQRATIEAGMVDTARALSLAVDRELQASIRTLQALATSEQLTSGDLGKFYRSAQDAIEGIPGWESMALMDPSGQQILNLRVPFGTKLPQAAVPEVIKRILATRAPVIFNLFQSPMVRTPLLLFAVPVIRRGEVQYVLEASTSSGFLATLLSQQKIPPNWTGTIVDNNNIIIARTRELEKFVGQPVQPRFVAETTRSAEGSFRAVTREGIPVYTAFSRSQLSRWTLALGIPAAEVEAPLRLTLVQMGVGGLLLLAGAMLLAALLGYRIERAAAKLSAGARSLGKGEAPEFQSLPILELDQVRRELEIAVARRNETEAALRQAQAYTESVLDSVADCQILFDRNWRYLYVNKAAIQGIGRPREQILGCTLWELYPDIVGTELDRQYHRAMDERILVDFDFHYLALDTWWKNRFYPVSEGLAVFATNITERKRAQEELQASREQLRALADYLQAVREEEKLRIARELHDEIGQALTAIKLSLERTLRERNNLPANLEPALLLANELIGRVRDLSLDLRPAMLDDFGLLPALTWHFGRFNNQFKIATEFNHAGLEGRRFAPEMETAAYRIVQEALTNVARHAGVDKVKVDVRADEKILRICVRDEGAGFVSGSLSPHITGGLSGMRERAIMLGGRLEIESAPGAGTLLLAELPLGASLADITERAPMSPSWTDEQR